MYFNEKRLNKLGKFKYFYKSFNVFCASNPLFGCILNVLQNIDFSNERISCTCSCNLEIKVKVTTPIPNLVPLIYPCKLGGYQTNCRAS